MMFSGDEKEVRIAEARAVEVKARHDALLVRCETWIGNAPHRKGCGANGADDSRCSCGRTPLLRALAKASEEIVNQRVVDDQQRRGA
jgi:hypothetical protein